MIFYLSLLVINQHETTRKLLDKFANDVVKSEVTNIHFKEQLSTLRAF